ncbi:MULTISPECIES: LysR family transcriptional regulator [unclassified Mesorhizobium]|uniref:LysR family transcriptional regulator n=1 Tax=unclassified Mesorhizobium TaxID=325217 RepID=UPI00112C60FF|nr:MULTISPECIES: LysR family transcriptional regulator [unclassified Mesorhizobium]TPJ40926.1 LysR family transcriptional regulator [Mesorhizobium sp. B2-6-6]MBZ9985296.1 LysR family transcriptional regulator [Mesorhizobium sp. BR-1-1-8]MCA0008629.1 LysR family transcriptional regulator [Mesorhizobium sp. B264B1B]MCA0022472.1 LysR family transcriptional regulator [Mesorhizobium sp. B264B1A]MCA0024466.1 LysR family transcriptional regulator [Mesorhizobium sp. B263B1A]
MDRFEAMSLLVRSAEAGSFSAAGRQLGVPLPTVSRKVAELETHLNTQLLVRSTRKLSLTEAGLAYVAACKRILEQVEEAESQASGEYTVPRGTLTMTAPIVFGRFHVVPVVNEFLARFPQISIQLTLTDHTINIVDEHIDLAVRVGMLPDSTLVATKVGEIRRVVCGSPDYFAAHGVPKTPDDLAEHMCVTFTALAAGMTWVFKPRGKATRSVRPYCRLKINTAESAIDAALAGVGVTNVLSYQIARPVAAGKLRIILEDYEPDPIPVHLVHTGQAILPLKLRRFMEFAASRLRKSLAADLAKLSAPKICAKTTK